MKNTEIYVLAKSHAFNRLSRRECSAHDIYKHLLKKKIPSEIAAEVVEELKTKQLLNDERYAKIMTRHQALSGKGPNWVRQKLKQNGIDLKIGEIQEIIQTTSGQTELELAKQFLARRYPNGFKGDRKITQKAYQSLLRRGFTYTVVAKAIADYRPEEFSDDFSESLQDPAQDPIQGDIQE